MLEGTSLQNSGIEFAFKRNVENAELCEMWRQSSLLIRRELKPEDALKLQKAIFNHYWYQVLFPAVRNPLAGD